MFCNACGAEIQPQFKVCPYCGRPIASATGVTLPSRLAKHLRILSILWLIAGALHVIPGVVLLALSGVARVAIPASEDLGRAVAPLVLSIIGGGLLVVAACCILVGWGLLKPKPWGRTLAIVFGFLLLLHPPFGTALGIYTLWVLVAEQSDAEYHRLARAS
jgi:hypothetical protein